MKKQSIIVLDFGSQYNQLLLKQIRKLGVYAQSFPFNTSLKELMALEPAGFIFSGGPSSVNEKEAKLISKEIFDLGVPILGICYGMQLISFLLGGKVVRGENGEYGNANFIREESIDPLFKGIPDSFNVWMSHFDQVKQMPKGFYSLGYSLSGCLAAMGNEKKKIYALQFHPETTHSQYGEQMLGNFLFEICKLKENWHIDQDFIENTINDIRAIVGDKKVVLGLSGGVDSSVAALIIHKAIGVNLHCIFVDTGLLRKNEAKKVMEGYRDFQMNISLVEAKDDFLLALRNISDPEEKRKIIGKKFVEVFEKKATEIKNVAFLGQGTIYPDIIESGKSKTSSSYVIKSHHNVGGLPHDLNLILLEPLKDLFKDEVRALGKELNLSSFILGRHPFPGPGLAVRIIGAIDEKKIMLLTKVDAIFMQELQEEKLYDTIEQAFAVLLPIKSVGVMGDERTYGYTIALRAVHTKDFMTATFSKLPWAFLEKVSTRITNEVRGINRVVYDISSKPPSTIEWE